MKKYSVAIILTLLALLGVTWWIQFALPRYQYIDLSIKQDKAILISKHFLSTRGFDLKDYKIAALLDVDDGTDRYLQKTIGTKESQKLIKDLNYDIFGWVVRFFKEKQKEEFMVFVSCKTGEVISFGHSIDETAARPDVDKETSRNEAEAFLKAKFGFNPDLYSLHSDNSKKQLHRTDYKFTWESKKVDIPWN